SGGTLPFRRLERCLLPRGRLLGCSAAGGCGGLARGLTDRCPANGGIQQLLEAVEQALGEDVKIADRVSVRIQTEEDIAVVGGNSDGKQVASRQREYGITRDQLSTGGE